MKNIEVEVAAKERKCHVSSKHVIDAGESHLAHYEGSARQNICLACAGKVLDVAQAHLATLRKKLKV